MISRALLYLNVRLNFEIFLAKVHKAISHGAVLQNELKVEDEIVVMESDYADDLAVMDNTEEGLQESTDLIAYYTSYAGLKINANKTQCMAISKCASQRPSHIHKVGKPNRYLGGNLGRMRKFLASERKFLGQRLTIAVRKEQFNHWVSRGNFSSLNDLKFVPSLILICPMF